MAICGIYSFTNKINGKIYIGQTTDMKTRYRYHKWSYNHKNNRYNKLLYKAMRKYGFDNFDFAILEECEPFELNAKEIKWIERFEAATNGYNQTLGGDATITSANKEVYQIDPKTKEIVAKYKSIAEAAREHNTFPAAIWSAVNKRTKTSVGYIWCYAKMYDKDAINQIVPLTTKEVRSKAVIQKDIITDEAINCYASITDASKYTGVSRTSINNVVKGRSKSAGGYRWQYEKEGNV